MLRSKTKKLTKIQSLALVGAIVLTAVAVIGLSVACSAGDTAAEHVGEVQAATITCDGGWYDCVSKSMPVAWWRFDETSGTVAYDSAPSGGGSSGGVGHRGTYVDAGLGQAGKYGTAVALAAPGPAYVRFPDSDDFSLVKAEDYFPNNVSSGWGTSVHGDAWAAGWTPGAYYRVSGGSAIMDGTTTSAVFGQWLSTNVPRADMDVQTMAQWTDHPANTPWMMGGAIVARVGDVNNYYRASLWERGGLTHALYLYVEKVVNGGYYVIGGPYSLGYTTNLAWYRIRFQLQGTTLSAKAWLYDPNSPWAAEPSSWQLSISDSSLTSGKYGLQASNASSDARPLYYFDEFRAQSLGMTINAWVSPSTHDFAGEPAPLCGSSGTVPSNYVNYGNKRAGSINEWNLRYYPDAAVDPSCGEDRRERLSGYLFGRANSQGAGAYYQDPSFVQPAINQWSMVTVVYDPGDAYDTDANAARTHFFFNAVESAHINAQTYAAYQVVPRNEAADAIFGADTAETALQQFQGKLDEVAIWDRALSATDIQTLYNAH